MNDEARFLDAIKANPQDMVLRLVYADWLEECGDARCEYLRIDGQLQELMDASAANESFTDPKVRQLRSQLKKLAKTLDANWVAFFDALRPKFVCCRACRKVIAAEEAIDTNPRSYRKMKTSRYCKLCFEDAVRSQLHRGSDSPGRRSSAASDYHGEASDDD